MSRVYIVLIQSYVIEFHNATNGLKREIEWKAETHSASRLRSRRIKYSILWKVHAFLGRVLWMYENMGTLHMLLLCLVSLSDSPSKLRGSLSEIWTVFKNSKAWPTLHKSMHLDPKQSQHENQCHGFVQTSTHHLIQNIITKDNVSINIDASVYYRVINARYAYYRVQNINAAIAEVTYAILKNTCGQFILQDLL